MSRLTVREFLQSLRDGKFTSFGCYPKCWITSDGGTLSFEACKSEAFQIARAIRDKSGCGWRVVHCDINWEDPELYCDHTNQRIESAYAEPCTAKSREAAQYGARRANERDAEPTEVWKRAEKAHQEVV